MKNNLVIAIKTKAKPKFLSTMLGSISIVLTVKV